MKLKLLAMAASAVALTLPALADTSSEEFQVSATVPDTCSMADIGSVNLNVVDIVTASGANSLQIESTSTGNGGDFYLSCNLENQVTITSQNGGLQNQTRSFQAGIDDPMFTDIIEYNVRLDNYVDGGNGAQPKLATKDGGPGVSSTSAQRGAIHRQVKAQITILPAQNPNLPLAGSYQDIVEIEVTSL